MAGEPLSREANTDPGLLTNQKIWVAQLPADQGIPENLRRITDAIAEIPANSDSKLIVFPECILTGYVYSSRGEVEDHSVALDGPELSAIAEACHKTRSHVVVGFLETAGQEVFNSAVLIDPSGKRVSHYRKVHLPHLGADRFVDPGSSAPPVVETSVGRVGIGICYDLRFPESARSLALSGADIIAQPSTMPPEAILLLESFSLVRACENRIFLALANRGDTERGYHFAGRSQIVDPNGSRIAEAGGGRDERISATVDLALARNKQVVNVPDQYQVSLFDDRRPDTYGALTDQQ